MKKHKLETQLFLKYYERCHPCTIHRYLSHSKNWKLVRIVLIAEALGAIWFLFHRFFFYSSLLSRSLSHPGFWVCFFPESWATLAYNEGRRSEGTKPTTHSIRESFLQKKEHGVERRHEKGVKSGELSRPSGRAYCNKASPFWRKQRRQCLHVCCVYSLSPSILSFFLLLLNKLQLCLFSTGTFII